MKILCKPALRLLLIFCQLLASASCKTPGTPSNAANSKAADDAGPTWTDVTLDADGNSSTCTRSPDNCILKDQKSGFLWGKYHVVTPRTLDDTRYNADGSIASSTRVAVPVNYGIDVIPWCDSFKDGTWRVPDAREFEAALNNGFLDAVALNASPSPLTTASVKSKWFWAYSYDSAKNINDSLFRFSPQTTMSGARKEKQGARILCVQGVSQYPHY